MSDILKEIQDIKSQLDDLRNRHLQMTNEMIGLEKRLTELRTSVSSLTPEVKEVELFITPIVGEEKPPKYIHQVQQELLKKKVRNIGSSFHVTQELEDFIGTNLISKIGILITIVGVFIGAKYAIDKELISPLMRIILSYVFAGVLFFIALRLKAKYENFSSILMGGGLAVTYFITYIAFGYYQLFSQGVAFALMIVTTVGAVAVALWYEQKVIALIGQVAAYAIPFLLSDGRGNPAILFTYISIINVGLLVLSFKKDWKILYRIAFFLTWLVYAFWIFSSSHTPSKFLTGLVFLAINFITFYITFLSYKILKKQMYQVGEIAILLLNALLFFFLGAYLIQENFGAHRVLTWFTLFNAIIHFAAGYFIYKLKLADKTVFQFILGLGLLFVTVAIPIEFDGNWVTLLWIVEATTLCYVASANDRRLYFDIALPLVIIALISLLQDWTYAYPYLKGTDFSKITVHPFVNLNFWLSLFVCSCLGYISYKAYQIAHENHSTNTTSFFRTILPVIFIFVLYFTFYNEIHLAWDIIIQKNNVSGVNNYQLFQVVTLLIFSCLYIAAFIWINAAWIKKRDMNALLLVWAAVVNLIIVFKGLNVLGELRDNYIQHPTSSSSWWLINIRYCCFIGLAVLWLSSWQAIKASNTSSSLNVFFSMLFNFTLLSIVCNEFVHWMDLAGYANQYKLGLSIICGVYALALVFGGIIRRKKYLRIGGMFLFGLTLLKLFFYDLSSLSSVSKTIVLLLLGILLLVASFLYNKYKDLLFTKDE